MSMICKAKPEDKKFIWQVHTEAIPEMCKSHYTQQQTQAWTSFLNPESYRQVREDGGNVRGEITLWLYKQRG